MTFSTRMLSLVSFLATSLGLLAASAEASAQDKPADPAPGPIAAVLDAVEVHGVLAGGGTIPLKNDPKGTVNLRQFEVDVVGKLGPVTALTVADFAILAGGGKDPILHALVAWQPNDWLTIKAGRTVVPLGYGRNPPPHKKIELTFPDLGITAPLFDEGVFATLQLSHVTIDLAAVTGLGRDLSSGMAPRPDGVARVEFAVVPRTFRVGLSGQAGPQGHDGRGSGTFYSVLETPKLLVEVEGAVSTEPARTAAGAYLLGVYRPNVDWDIYLRGDVLRVNDTNAVPSLSFGANWRFVKHLTARAGATVPLVKDTVPTVSLVAQAEY